MSCCATVRHLLHQRDGELGLTGADLLSLVDGVRGVDNQSELATFGSISGDVDGAIL